MSTVGPDVLGEIKEKNMTHVYAPPPKPLTLQGFPEPFVRDDKVYLLLVYIKLWSVAELHNYVSWYGCSETEILNLCILLSCSWKV
jgi:hypothetical protein